MVPEKNVFINYSGVGPHRGTTAGGGTPPLQGVGNVQLRHVDSLKGVLDVQSLRVHLILLQQLFCDIGWQFILDEDDCFLCNKVFETRFSSLRREGGLLLLNTSS